MMKISLKNVSLNIFLLVSFCLLTAQTSAADNIETLTANCVACHGENGIASANEWPSLAGQKQGYLLAQLNAFQDGNRENMLMTGLLDSMSEQDLANIAEYYSDLPFEKAAASSINQAGENVRANCISCHGMTGQTINDTWPNLAGQNKGYLLQQLKDFSSNKRHSIIMNVIASELTEQQMKDVAEYYEQIGTVQ
ncbi:MULTISPECIES: c-type cytochrome [Aliiglaciecola]|uniref:c-type cytochrome n=1 Tax=Aliiglaciecola TaxID=1406885 RepID=UPI001C08ECA7|nr:MULTISPECIES: c-type cytochrome [Aliiglaciecola]MBU2879268.1 cytochrome c4 [Aliiglaciecola lipolytica]MDO6709720.1 c-type cytochrome [Aliiglaciecola sp. 2_MG-2023]MDO6750738.1 c-type cytochrome [Aliiglaciecola sp. 1_MG-2023]